MGLFYSGKLLIPKSIPQALLLGSANLFLGFLVSTKMEAQYLPSFVLLIVTDLVLPSNLLCSSIFTPSLIFGRYNKPFSKSTVIELCVLFVVYDFLSLFFLNFGSLNSLRFLKWSLNAFSSCSYTLQKARPSTYLRNGNPSLYLAGTIRWMRSFFL